MASNKSGSKKSTVNQDPVSQQKIWTEHLIKESKLQKISTQFSLNPQSLNYITPKTTKIVPVSNKENILINYPLLNVDDTNNNDSVQLRETIKRMELEPTKKYKYPVSTAMDYGWFVNNSEYSIKQAKLKGSDQNKRRWHYSLSQSEITRFAQHYYLTMGTTLFSKPKNPNATGSK